MVIGVPKETFPGERRVALTPDVIPALVKKGLSVLIEADAGASAGYPDAKYKEKGAEIAPNRAEIFSKSDVVLQVRALGANPETGKADLGLLKKDQTIIGFCEPLSEHEATKAVAEKGATLFSMELMPRITRAQSMDALSSMATVAGYKAVILAAEALPKMFPMLMTAAGTLAPARVFIIGVGVAGLQAIASAKRLGAVVSAYDVRPVVKEQVESLGAKFVELPLEAGDAQDKGGYAKALGEEFYKKQRELMGKVLAESDVVITTAAIPGKKAPILVTKEQAALMPPGSVLVDIAAERGGNCGLTKPGETVVLPNGVTVMGPLNLPSTAPFHASQMYAKNITTFLLHLVGKDVSLNFTAEDEITKETLVTRGGEIVHARVKELIAGGK
jgi:H+-translocating NAD(P) transhydrogenase subunit alpha